MDGLAQRYQELVDARKACRRCSGLVNPSVVSDGAFDSSEIGPWSLWLGDLKARVLVVGQDWGDQRAFERHRGRDVAHNGTNRMLRELLASIDIAVHDVPEVNDASFPAKSSGVFLTNAVLCLKDHGCQAAVQREWFQNCGTQFLRPQIELINPEVAICLGERAYAAVLAAYQLPPVRNWRATVEGAGVALPGGPLAFAVYHCGARILNTHRNRDQQFEDWKRIGAALRARRPLA